MTHMLRRLRCRGGIDIGAWLVGIVGFTGTYFVWVFSQPAITALILQGHNLQLPDVANQKFAFISTMYNVGMVVNAVVWFVYILLSSIRSEVQERDIPIM